MHEMAVTENILRITLAEAEKAGALRIEKITLVIGELSSIVDESVQWYFDLMSEGTPASGAALEFKRFPATLYCTSCGQTFPKQEDNYRCPSCDGEGNFTGDGKDFYIESIEVETPWTSE